MIAITVDSPKFEVHSNVFAMFKYANQFADTANSLANLGQ